MAVSRRHKPTNQANQRFSQAMMPCRARTVATWSEAAAGERIVAFARPGKPSKIAFSRADWTGSGPGRSLKNASCFQRFLKPDGLETRLRSN